MTSDPQAAADALAALNSSQARLAKAGGCPPERHLAFAALMGVYVASPAAPGVWWFVVEAALICTVPLIVLWDRRRTGMFINGYRRGRTRPITFLTLAAMLALFLPSAWLGQIRHLPAASLALGAVAGVIAWFASAKWQAIWRSELGVGGAS